MPPAESLIWMNRPRQPVLLQALGVFLLSFLIHVSGTWILPLVDRDETWYAEAAREMTQSSNFVVPTFNNRPWMEKPPLLYWAQAASFRLFGESSFSARLPAVLASALTTLVLFGFCMRLYGAHTALKASIGFTLCLEMALLGKAGLTDMPAVFFLTLATWAGWELIGVAGGKKRTWWWVFYLSLALAFLAKGPLALLPAGSILAYGLWERPPDFLKTMKFPWGFLLVSGAVAIWFVPALMMTGGAYFQEFILEHVVERMFRPMDHHGGSNPAAYVATLPFYFLTVFLLFFPWSLWFPKAFRAIRMDVQSAERYLLSGILVPFGIFSLISTKLPHYTLPAFPLIACVVARFIPWKSFAWLGSGMVAFNLLVSFCLFPFLARFSVMTHFAESPWLVPDMPFAAVNYHEPGLVWNLRRRLTTWGSELRPDEVENYLKQPGARLCILPSDLAATFPMDKEWRMETARGFNISKGKSVEMTMVVKTR